LRIGRRISRATPHAASMPRDYSYVQTCATAQLLLRVGFDCSPQSQVQSLRIALLQLLFHG